MMLGKLPEGRASHLVDSKRADDDRIRKAVGVDEHAGGDVPQVDRSIAGPCH